MAKAPTIMPSSIGTISTENDSVNSPGDQHSRHAGASAGSPATSTSSPARSPRGHPNGHDKMSTQREPYPGKRKRSRSVDGREEAHSPRPYDYHPPKRNEQPQQLAGHALTMLGTNRSTAAPPTYYSPNGDPRAPYWAQDRHPGEADRPQSAVEEGARPAHSYTTPPPGSAGHAADSLSPPPSRSSGSVVQVNKRKRNFSNRTKTGCMTCRQRKKKCDEARPICEPPALIPADGTEQRTDGAGNNCQRGGFQCQGYTVVRGSVWPKTNGAKGPVPLQSKDGQQSTAEAEPPSAHPVHHAPHPPTPLDPVAEPNHGQYAPGSESRGRSSYTGQPWPPQQGHPQSYTNEHLPPLSELARSDTTKPDYPSSAPPPPPPPPSAHSTRDMSGRPPSQSIPPPVPPAPNPSAGHWPPPAQTDYRAPYAPPPRLETPHHANPPMIRVATTGYDYPKSGAKTFTVEEVERSRMLRHTRFNYFDPTLKNERQRCAEALARYNNACMLRSGVTEQEAQKMLMKVFDPSLDTTHHPVAPCKEKGVLGPGVKIEGPFKCTYGYNLRIMDNVFIGENTRIDDSARVDIGARTWIGPNVTILTTDVSKDMVDRKGTESTCYAAPVTIHSEVVIGSNAVIYPGVTLSRGSTVEPFALVRDSLGENQVQKAAVGPRAT